MNVRDKENEKRDAAREKMVSETKRYAQDMGMFIGEHDELQDAYKRGYKNAMKDFLINLEENNERYR